MGEIFPALLSRDEAGRDKNRFSGIVSNEVLTLVPSELGCLLANISLTKLGTIVTASREWDLISFYTVFYQH